MSNRRIWYSSHSLGLAPLNSTTYTAAHGCQSLGINTTFNLQPIMELGQSSLYSLIENIPEVEINCEKVLDGYPLLYHLATQGASDGSLIGRSNQQCMVAVSVYGDTQSASSGTPTSQIEASGMFWSQHSLSFMTDKPFTESITLVGNNKINKGTADFTPQFSNADAPLALQGSGGVQLRQSMIFYPILGGVGHAGSLETASTLDTNGQLKAFLTILPTNINGISSSGTNDISSSTGDFGCHVQHISTSVSAGRDSVLELGRKYPYFRFMSLPVAVTTEISIIATDMDTLQATEAGVDGQGNNSVNQTIKLRTREGTWADLGTTNKCQSVSFGGGNTDGGQSTLTYSYITYDNYFISHPADPSAPTQWPY